MSYRELYLMQDVLNHLPVNAEIVDAFVNNPQATYHDLEALYWSVSNTPEGFASPLIQTIGDRLDDMLLNGEA